jgi:hypothetical protein
MLPIRDEVLPLHVLAEYWSRELAGIRTAAEIHDELLSAFWQDELMVFGPSGENRLDRKQILGWLTFQREHPGFIVVDNAESIPPRSQELSNGGLRIDLREYLVIPQDQSHWTEDILSKAYRVLTVMSFEDFHDLLKPGFRAYHTTQLALTEYCHSMGYELPRFWFGTEKRDVANGPVETRAGRRRCSDGSHRGRSSKQKRRTSQILASAFPACLGRPFSGYGIRPSLIAGSARGR